MTASDQAGACFCGDIAAEIRGEPFWVCYDHDDDCRRAIGAPMAVWVGYRAEAVHWTRGEPKSFSKTPGITRTFCARCGSSIGYRDDGLPGELYLTVGFLDRPEAVVPQAHAFWRMRLPWLAFADSLPKLDDFSRRRAAESGNPADRV